MVLRLYNTLTRTKEDFVPLDPKNVRMYVCGPTVYDFAHIGNARPVIVFDVLFRLLRHLYGAEHVTYVRNITDVDDKINARAAEIAAEKNIPIEQARAELTAVTAKQYDEDVAALGCLPPTYAPRATQYIPQMVAMIERLIASGHAYAADGHVLFDVTSKADYGKLARRSVNEMIAGARVEVAPYKKNPTDFVLWKPSDDSQPGWDSPWGRGRPGWHIECSAMGEALLGETFDIHGGGIDLMFPHHENEIAQSEGAHGDHPLARVWMHNGFLQVEGEKMSKSLGNFFTIRDLLNDWPGEVLRFNMLRTHYRQPLDWTVRSLEESFSIYNGWFTKADDLCSALFSTTALATYRLSKGLNDALRDDLNTPSAITEIHKSAGAMDDAHYQYERDGDGPFKRHAEEFLAGLYSLGLYPEISEEPAVEEESWVEAFASPNVTKSDIRKLRNAGFDFVKLNANIEIRSHFREAKKFHEADYVRDELLAKGIVLKDDDEGKTTWEVKR